MITNTVVKTTPEFLAEAIDKINPKNMHIKNGPQRSPVNIMILSLSKIINFYIASILLFYHQLDKGQ